MSRTLLILLATAFCAGATADRQPETIRASAPAPTRISSSTNGLESGARRLAVTDSFYLYGGPGTLEGKFQDAAGNPDWQGWTGHDHTETPVYWQVSTHNAENLGGHGPGNRAYWCGQTLEQQPHFWQGGYGSSWNAQVMYESDPVADPSIGQLFEFDFLFNFDVEPGYDFLLVEVDSAGTWVQLHDNYTFSGSNRDQFNVFQVPGWRFSDHGQSAFVFAGNDYGGPDGDRIRLRISVRSDGAFDDQTGLWPTIGGAAQIDDLSVNHAGVALFEDFEGSGPYLVKPVLYPFVGDFSQVLPGLADLDPAHENRTPVVAFLDQGQAPPNGPGLDGTVSTGGSTSPTSGYAVPGGFVVNREGGLTAGPEARPLDSDVRSPEIAWDLPGAADDGADVAGAVLSFDVYSDNPIANGILYQWGIGPGFSTREFTYRPSNAAYSLEGPRWERVRVDITQYIRPDRFSDFRIAFRVRDLADQMGLPGFDSTPAPWFDNVQLIKYRLAGPLLECSWNGAMQNMFPASHQDLDVWTPAERAQLWVRPNPEITLDTFSADLIDLRLVWALRKNPFFEDAIRTVPATADDENVVTGPVIWTGERLGAAGWGVDLEFDGLLDDAWFPGDVLEYYIRAEDELGRVTTLPADLTGFGSVDGSYDPAFVARALPSITDTAGTQPGILVYAGGASRVDLTQIRNSLGQLGLEEGVDFDVFWNREVGTVAFTQSLLQVVAGYRTILVFGGGGEDYPYQDHGFVWTGDYVSRRVGLNRYAAMLLEQWSALPGDRRIVSFGSILGYSLTNGYTTEAAYLGDRMAVQLVADDLRASAGTGSAVVPADTTFTTTFAVSSDQQGFAALDHVEPIFPATRLHTWTYPDGSPHPSAAASVLSVEIDGPDRKTWLTFPFSFRFIQSSMQRASGLPARTQLLGEVLEFLDAAPASGTPTSAPPQLHATLGVRPNPFNPRTTVHFTVPVDGRVRLRVFDLRGRLVRTLEDGPLKAGDHRREWDGRDQDGASAASGVYLVRAELAGVVLQEKVVLVK